MQSIAVYKTTVESQGVAESITCSIRRQFPDYDVSFDLDDCDKVLRVENGDGSVDGKKIQTILKSYGYRMEKLP